MVDHDYKRVLVEDRRRQPKPMGKGFIYLVIAIAVANALFLMPAFYILN